ncbi:Ribokinase [Methylobacterium sp. 4-46]|uniref:PfkB family carbohydrate kinase n=1 Tax=unclassified Methylobacterium TaxID=2615210 RepID=UPI000165CDDE|nr:MULTISPECIES: PfkB family carbohydrate kinase [Methylobacterium]ACA20137.1 Ribokinase [Methylobacterium sp. 4-46]WFT79317.1 PfkB family carbohydrate kinase [Methylobacterium nodulans]
MSDAGGDMGEGASLFVLGSFVAACSATVARLPRPGETLEARAFQFDPGGKGLNLAVGARRLGARVDGLIAVGHDAFGDLAAAALRRADLPDTLLRRVEAPTGAGIGFVDAAGENCIAVYPGANARLGAAEVAEVADRLVRARLVLAQFETSDAAVSEAFRRARAAGVETLLNPSPFRPPPPGLLARTGILVVNATEAAALGEALGLAGAAPADLAAALLDRGPRLVVVTLGRGGAIARAAGEPLLVQPALPVAALDTIGAGDAFTAGLAVSLAEGHPLAACLRHAAACAACVVARRGVFEALPDRAARDAALAALSAPPGP